MRNAPIQYPTSPVGTSIHAGHHGPCHSVRGKNAAYGEVMTDSRPPFPPYDLESARAKVQAAEDAWNTRDPHKVSLAYTEDSQWRNRDLFLNGRDEIVEFLTAKWKREQDYVLRKSLWSFHENRIAVRFQYEWHDDTGQWWRSYGNELWEFDDRGLMRRREASINDVAIDESERRLSGPRPADERTPPAEIPLR
jgi:nuclear transport factor 2 (NTF2) superfamily protein